MTEQPEQAPGGEAGVGSEAQDPFAPEHVGAFTLITMMRIYDVQMALLNEVDPASATRLHELHSQGKLLGSFPWLDPDEE